MIWRACGRTVVERGRVQGGWMTTVEARANGQARANDCRIFCFRDKDILRCSHDRQLDKQQSSRGNIRVFVEVACTETNGYGAAYTGIERVGGVHERRHMTSNLELTRRVHVIAIACIVVLFASAVAVYKPQVSVKAARLQPD